MKTVIDSRFLIEHFYSDKAEVKRRTSSKLRELIKRGEGLLPTIVIDEVIRVTCERRGIEEAKLRHISFIRSS